MIKKQKFINVAAYNYVSMYDMKNYFVIMFLFKVKILIIFINYIYLNGKFCVDYR